MNIIQVQSLDGSIIEQVLIDNSDGSTTVMPKADYEATLAANSAPQG
jgi:hypothetical protein